MPLSREKTPDWTYINEGLISPFLSGLQATEQNPIYHGEGSVYAHTRMVVEALLSMDGFWEEKDEVRLALFLGALFHDVGKIKTTKWENDAWTSPHHAESGEHTVRSYLWKTLDICGDRELTHLRETVCTLIRYHMKPGYLAEYDQSARMARRYASEGELLPDFTMSRLSMLAEADMRGRIAADRAASVEKIEFVRELIAEYGCAEAPFAFPTPHTKFSYFSGKSISPELTYYDDTSFEVILLSGLPGVGKDTYISEHLKGLPVISLDEIRVQMKISPDEPQGAVVARARELSRELLRKQIPFVWNATNLTDEVRRNQVELFSKYGARVKMVYLECPYEENLRRNRERAAYVPESVIDRLISKCRPPRPYEAHCVEWHFV